MTKQLSSKQVNTKMLSNMSIALKVNFLKSITYSIESPNKIKYKNFNSQVGINWRVLRRMPK